MQQTWTNFNPNTSKITIKWKNKLDFLCLLISIAGGVVLLIGFTTNGKIYKDIGKAFLKNAIAGFYMIVIGWVVAITGYFSK